MKLLKGPKPNLYASCPTWMCQKRIFFKTVIDNQLVDMEETSLEVEVLKDVASNNSTLEDQEDEHHEV